MWKKRQRPSQRAFTLIELLIVVAIIAILAAIAVPNFLEAQTRAKITRVRTDLRTLATAMETYFTDNSAYPPDYDSGEFGVTPNNEYMTYASLTTPIAYLSTIPTDYFLEKMQESITGKPTPYFQFNGGNRANFYGSSIKWLMSSPGPDLRDNVMWGQDWRRMHEVSYDPTNGTKSSGDIGRSNVTAYP